MDSTLGELMKANAVGRAHLMRKVTSLLPLKASDSVV